MIRKVTIKDFHMMFDWVNDKDVIYNSRYQRESTLEQYTKWFNEKISDDKTHLFIVEIEGRAVGQIRIEQNNNEALISYSIDKCNRGKGYGTHAIKNVEDYIIKNRDEFNEIINLVGYVKASNMASIKVFEKQAYIKEIDNNEFVKFAKCVS